MKPYVLNANNFGISPELVRHAIVEARDATKAVANPTQRRSWEVLGLRVRQTITVEAHYFDFVELLPRTQCTLGGLPIEHDPALPDTVIEFRDDAGQVLARIENLAIPNG